MRKKSNIKKWIVGVVLMLTTFVGVGQRFGLMSNIWMKTNLSATTIYTDSLLKYRNPNKDDFYIFNVGIKKDSVSPKNVTYFIFACSNYAFDNPMFAFGMGKCADSAKYITPYGDCKLFELYTFNGRYVDGKDTFPYVECKVSKELLEAFKGGKIKNVSIYHTWNREDHSDPVIKCGNYFKDFVTRN